MARAVGIPRPNFGVARAGAVSEGRGTRRAGFRRTRAGWVGPNAASRNRSAREKPESVGRLTEKKMEGTMPKRTLRRIVADFLCPPPPPKSETDLGKRILEALRREGFQTDGPGNPMDHIGTALQLARETGITLVPGLSFGSCRAVLPRECWKGLPKVSYIPLGDWIDRVDPCEAICLCALSCRNVGIL